MVTDPAALIARVVRQIIATCITVGLHRQRWLAMSLISLDVRGVGAKSFINVRTRFFMVAPFFIRPTSFRFCIHDNTPSRSFVAVLPAHNAHSGQEGHGGAQGDPGKVLGLLKDSQSQILPGCQQ